MGLNRSELSQKSSLTAFEKQWLSDRNIDHPALHADTADDAGTEIPETFESYEELSIPQLKELLRQRNLTVSGTKPELISRLESDDENSGE